MPISFFQKKQAQNIRIFKFNNILCYFIEYSHPPSQKVDFPRTRTTMMNNSTSFNKRMEDDIFVSDNEKKLK